MAPTPKSQERKRKVAEEDTSNTPAKRRASRAKKGDSSMVSLDAEDPFSFENKEDSHPEPLKNISIERTAFGGIKFSRSPPNASQRYVSVEKIAERRGNVSGTLNTPISTPRPSSSMKASGNLNKNMVESPKATPKVKRGTPSVTASAKGNTKPKETDTPIATPSSVRRAKLTTADFDKSAMPKEKKLTLDELCVPPTLSEKEQLEVDTLALREQHKLLDSGARVYALWNKEYYAAIVCGRDGYSCYYTYFVEDHLKRLIPSNGVIPLAVLKNGMKVSAIVPDEDDQPTGKTADIVEVPAADNASEWVKANFKLKLEDENDVINVDWSKIFLLKDQYKAICSTMDTNTTIFVEAENIINESRSSRRSRTTRFSVGSNDIQTSTPQPASASRAKVARTPKVLKTPAREGSVGNNTSQAETPQPASASRTRTPRNAKGVKTPILEELIESATPQTETSTQTTPASRTRTPRLAKSAKTSIPEETADNGTSKVETLKVMPSSASRLRTPRSTKVLKTPVREESKKDEDSEMDVSAAPAEDSTQLSPRETQASDTTLSLGSQNGVTKLSVEGGDEVKSVESSEPEKTSVSAVNDSQPIDSVLPSANEDEKVVDNAANYAITSATELNNLDSKQDEDTEMDVDVPLSDEPESSVQDAQTSVLTTTSESQNGTTKEAEENQKSKSTDDQELKSVEKTPISAIGDAPKNSAQQPISIALVPSPADEEEKSIFKNMKFVLTSATRLKKNSDFNKRDYRTKIEERGGVIIDDFTSLKSGETAYLIADTYYRTHKYLSALSLSVPCVKHDWIYACVVEKKFIDHAPFMLPAGESSIIEGQVCPWKALKGTLLTNKTVWVYSNVQMKPDERTICFVDIWSSIIKNLGANLIDEKLSSLDEKLEFCDNKTIDILLTDSSCEKALAEKILAQNGMAVSSEWVIQAIVTGELPDVSSSERFRFDTLA